MLNKNILVILGLVTFIFGCKNGGIAPGDIASVTPASLVAISLSPANQFIARNSQFKLRSMGTYDDASLSEVTSGIVWSVDDASIATISSSGLLVNTWAGGVNNATRELNVTATHTATGLTSTTKITVVSASLSSIAINPTSITVAPRATVDFTVIANMTDGSTLDVTNSVTAAVNNANATVAATTLSGVTVGTGTLSVSYNGLSANTGFTVAAGASSGGTTNGTGLLGDYFEGTDFNSFFGSRVDATVNFSWNADVNNLGQDQNYSIRWTGSIKAQKSETYTFYTQADDGTRLSINGVPFASCINDWTLHGVQERTCATTFALTAGQKVSITLEYFEGPGVSFISLLWSSPTTPKQVIPQAYLYPTAP